MPEYEAPEKLHAGLPRSRELPPASRSRQFWRKAESIFTSGAVGAACDLRMLGPSTGARRSGGPHSSRAEPRPLCRPSLIGEGAAALRGSRGCGRAEGPIREPAGGTEGGLQFASIPR